MGGIVRDQSGILLEIGGISDHVHLLIRLSPRVALSDVMRIVKANSSKWYNEEFAPKIAFGWQRGFGAFSVSVSNIESGRKYIKNQEEHHRGLGFEDEYRAFLTKHGIAFEELHLFEMEEDS